MLKEIHEQPQAVRNALKVVDRNEIDKAADMILEAKNRYLIGVGTTYYVVLTAQYYFKLLADVFIPVISSDEFEHLADADENTVSSKMANGLLKITVVKKPAKNINISEEENN